ncbi:hypothetical protein CC2G_001828 [Coprinopsis cinerea AmutBmut pab1-1]|nr:hypothetical protein CC2G_001828 [Coprinopsis cinerea AmutBmut pab1-1]
MTNQAPLRGTRSHHTLSGSAVATLGRRALILAPSPRLVDECSSSIVTTPATVPGDTANPGPLHNNRRRVGLPFVRKIEVFNGDCDRYVALVIFNSGPTVFQYTNTIIDTFFNSMASFTPGSHTSSSGRS